MQISLSIYGMNPLTTIIVVHQRSEKTVSGTESTPSPNDTARVSMGT